MQYNEIYTACGWIASQSLSEFAILASLFFRRVQLMMMMMMMIMMTIPLPHYDNFAQNFSSPGRKTNVSESPH